MLITLNVKLKMKFKNVVFLLMLLKMCVVFGQNSIHQKRIVIDVGHGGNDSGAIGVNGIQEKDIVLNIAKEIIRLNKMILDDRFDIYLTRYKDTLISLTDRTKLARILKADLFISLHCNQVENSKARGTEVFVSNTKGKYLRQSILMGYLINSKMVKELGLNGRGVKFANFLVLRETVDYCPSVLIEIAFLSNWDEAELMKAIHRKREYALTILNSIIKYQGE